MPGGFCCPHSGEDLSQDGGLPQCSQDTMFFSRGNSILGLAMSWRFFQVDSASCLTAPGINSTPPTPKHQTSRFLASLTPPGQNVAVILLSSRWDEAAPAKNIHLVPPVACRFVFKCPRVHGAATRRSWGLLCLHLPPAGSTQQANQDQWRWMTHRQSEDRHHWPARQTGSWVLLGSHMGGCGPPQGTPDSYNNNRKEKEEKSCGFPEPRNIIAVLSEPIWPLHASWGDPERKEE